MFRKSKLSFKIAELKNYSNWKCRKNGCSITKECFIFEVENKPSRKQKSCKKDNWIEKTDYLLTGNAEEVKKATYKLLIRRTWSPDPVELVNSILTSS